MHVTKKRTRRPKKVVNRMIEWGQILCVGPNTEGTLIYWLEPSQRPVGKIAAIKAIKDPRVEPLDLGISGDTPQSYRVRDGQEI